MSKICNLILKSRVNIINGNLTNNTALDQTIMNCSAVIYNIGIIRAFPSQGITYQKLHLKAALNYPAASYV